MSVKMMMFYMFLSISAAPIATDTLLEEVEFWPADLFFFMDYPVESVRKAARIAEDFNRFPDKSQEVQGNFTLSDVALYDGEDGRPLYIVVDGKVCDVTDFCDYHPAGAEPLKKYAGREASAAMHATNMPSEVYTTYINRFIVGQIVTTEPETTLSTPSVTAYSSVDSTTEESITAQQFNIEMPTEDLANSQAPSNGDPSWSGCSSFTAWLFGGC